MSPRDQLNDLADRIDGLAQLVGGVSRSQRAVQDSVIGLYKPRGGTDKPGLSGRERFVRHATLHALSSSILTPDDVWTTRYMRRGVTDPATTTRPTWAVELVVADVLDFLAAAPKPRLFPALAALGLSVTITGSAKIPYAVPGSAKGGWIAESEAIPVVKLTLSTASLTPKKLASISTFTDDLTQFSTFDVERIVATVLQADLGALLDGALVDDQPASAIRPPGLRSFNAALPAGISMAEDLATLAEAINSTALVIMCNPLQAISLALMPGRAPFPVLVSDAIPADVVIAIDASAFISTTGAPEIKASENALLHESDTPTAIGTAGTPAVVAAPARSLWQSQCNAVRCIVPTGWALTAANRVAWIEDVVW